MAEKEELELEEGEKKGKSKLIIIIAAVLLCISVSAGAVFFLAGDDEEQTADAEPVKIQSMYHRFENPFIVTIVTAGKQRYLQISVTIKTKDQKVIKLLKTHAPVVKSSLNNIFGAQELDYLQTPEGREALNQDALNAVQTFITSKDETLVVEKVLFTNFVMQ
jgi:flagellar FliL protein